MITDQERRNTLRELGQCVLDALQRLARYAADKLNPETSRPVNLVWTVRCSASRSFALARSARTRRRIPFEERPPSEQAVVSRP